MAAQVPTDDGFDRTAALAEEEIERMARIKLDFQYEYRTIILNGNPATEFDREWLTESINKHAKDGFSFRESIIHPSYTILIMDKCNNYYEVDDEPLADIL